MPKFAYIARDSRGVKITGSEEAPSSDELIGRLQLRNLTVVNVLPEAREEGPPTLPRAAGKQRKFKRRGVSGDDLVVFARQLATLLGAGITILKSLNIISKQVYSRKFYNTLVELQKHMEAGLSFHEAMSRFPRVFSDLWINLVESGEASGNLAVVLSRLATYLEKKAAFKRKIISALVYPAMLMFVGLGALFFLTVKIIPTFAELFKGFNVQLPLMTRALIQISNFVRQSIWAVLGAGTVLFFLFKRYVRTKEGRKRYEQLQFRLPLFGELFRSLVVERFSSEMSTLIESGVPLLYSLEITEHSVNNSVMAELIRKVKDDVRQGKPLNSSLDKSKFFEPMVIQMITIGEEIGELPQMLKRINTFYEEYTETFLSRFTSMFEPIMLVFMGAVIGIMVIGMFLPIFQIASLGAAG
ncbi:MAG: type II secretion system F family protein [Candidatus Omnitrophica bacterium]|nr:type II secretion system F family protein [Candidatus Omnitrophota bacterium]MDD5552993.1 type II secretion system F family protein [Candidatus Omnitrophota bacterium]